MAASQNTSDANTYRQALLLFLAMAAATAAWLGLNLVFPGIQPTGISQTVSRLMIHGAILAGLWVGLARAGFNGNKHLRIWLVIAVPFTVWLVLVWWVAFASGFRARPGVPTLPPAIFLPLIVGLLLLLPSKRIGSIARCDPGVMAGRAAALSCARRDFPGRMAARAHPGRIRVTGRQRRCAGRVASGAGGL